MNNASEQEDLEDLMDYEPSDLLDHLADVAYQQRQVAMEQTEEEDYFNSNIYND